VHSSRSHSNSRSRDRKSGTLLHATGYCKTTKKKLQKYKKKKKYETCLSNNIKLNNETQTVHAV